MKNNIIKKIEDIIGKKMSFYQVRTKTNTLLNGEIDIQEKLELY